MDQTIRFILNGKPVSLSVDGERMLLWVLRTDLGLTGTKFGCGKSLCGACTVIVDGEAVRSCVVPVKEVAGKKVLTIEGLARDGRLHPLQEAFMKHDALQCGYCTPGMILSAYSLLLKNSKPAVSDIVDALNWNLCRCGSHTRIIQAVREAAGTLTRSPTRSPAFQGGDEKRGSGLPPNKPRHSSRGVEGLTEGARHEKR